MSDYIVTRTYNFHGSRDYLCSWDILWGPVWSMSAAQAIRFDGPLKALDALDTARAICRPVPWIVPDLGESRLHITPV